MYFSVSEPPVWTDCGLMGTYEVTRRYLTRAVVELGTIVISLNNGSGYTGGVIYLILHPR